jgi:hypothetical protein
VWLPYTVLSLCLSESLSNPLHSSYSYAFICMHLVSQEGRIPSWIASAYSRSLGMEAREAEHGPFPQHLSTFDSSEADNSCMPPALEVLCTPSELHHW